MKKMKRRSLSLLAAAVIMAVAVFAVACDNNGGNGSQPTPTPTPTKTYYSVTAEGGYIGADPASHTARVLKDSSVTITAAVPSGKIFAGWRLNGSETVSITDNPYTFTAISDMSFTAVFTDPQPEVPTYCVVSITGGSADGKSEITVEKGDVITVTADDNGRDFLRWVVDGEEYSRDNPCEITVTRDMSISAEFSGGEIPEPPAVFYDVTIIGGKSDGRNFVTAEENSQLTVTADSSQNTTFVRWLSKGEEVSRQNPYTFTVTGDLILQAEFDTVYNVTVEGGRIDGEGSSFAAGASVTVVPDPPAGKNFTEWRTDGNKFASSAERYTFTVSHDVNIKAVYGEKSPVAGKSRLTVIGGQFYADATYTTPIGTYKDLDAADKSDRFFVKADLPEGCTMTGAGRGWYVGDSFFMGGETCSNRMLWADGSVLVAVWSRMFTLAVSDGYINGEATLDTAQFEQFEEVTVTAKKYPNRKFREWRIDGSAVSFEESFTFALSADTDIEAVYTDYHTVNAVNATIEGSDADTLVVADREFVTFIASVPVGMFFNNGWFVNGALQQGGLTLKIRITADTTVRPSLLEIFRVTVVGGSVAGGGTSADVVDGNEVTVEVSVPDGKRFDGWLIGGRQVADKSQPSYTFRVGADVEVQAMLIDLYTVQVIGGKIISAGGESVDAASGTFDSGVSVTVKADDRSAEKLLFAGWKIGASQNYISTEQSYTFTLGSSVALTADFKQLVTLTVRNADGAGGFQSFNYVIGGTVTLEKVANPSGKVFSKWTIISGDLTDFSPKANPCEFVINSDAVIEADFINAYTVKMIGATGLINNKTEGIFAEGTYVILQAEVPDGYRFDRWVEADGTPVSASGATARLKIVKNMEIKAEFVRIVNVIVNGGKLTKDDGTEASSGAFDIGATVSVVLTNPDSSKYTFKGWTVAGQAGMNEKSDANFTFEVNPVNDGVKEIILTAKFEGLYNITVENSDGSGLGSPLTYVREQGQTVALSAGTPPNARMSFEGWYSGDSLISPDAGCEYTVASSDAVIEARWSMLYSQRSTVLDSVANAANYPEYYSGGSASFTFPGISEGENVVVQGIDLCESLNWMFICGYVSPSNGYSSDCVIFVLDMGQNDPISGNPGKFIKEIIVQGTDNNFHAGGIAVTGKNIFVANGGKLWRIPLDKVIAAKRTAFVSFEPDQIDVPVKASYATFDDQNSILWVGEFELARKNYITDPSHHNSSDTGLTAWTVGYKLDESGSAGFSLTNGFRNSSLNGAEGATPDYVLWHCDRIQGMALAGNKIVLSRSYVRTGDSSPTNGVQQMLIYDNPIASAPHTKVTVNGNEIDCWLLESSKTPIRVAPMTEDLTAYRDPETGKYYVYVATESGSWLYNGSGSLSKHPMDIAWKWEIVQ